MKKTNAYASLFTAEFLMGPNSMKALEAMLETSSLPAGWRVLDLGCGKGLTTLLLAKEAGCEVFATDLWITATENHCRFREWGIADSVIPIHADATDLPFADNFFDAVVSIDAYHYFGTKPGFFEEKILPLVKKGGKIVIAVPGLKAELPDPLPQVVLDWVEGDENEAHMFHSADWWKQLLQVGGCEVTHAFDLANFDECWADWFTSGHPFAQRDEEFFRKGLKDYLALVGLVIEKK